MNDDSTTHTPKVALVTGASSGIGYATALALMKRGAHVTGTARRLDRLHALAEAGASLPGGFLPVQADVTDPAQMQAAVAATLQRWGRLDVIVANAGIGQRGALIDADWSDLDAVLRTNIDGVLHTLRAGVPAIRQGGRGGHVVIVSSVVFNMISPYAATYAATKACVSSLARSLRYELDEDRIHVTDVLVGRTRTEFNDRRLGAGSRRSSKIPEMPAEQVAEGIARAVYERPRPVLTLRAFDRLLVWANVLIPGFIGRRARQQYR